MGKIYKALSFSPFMAERYPLNQLKKKVKQIENYLGPRLGWSMDHWPDNLPDRWIMEYCMLLKERYYKNVKRQSDNRKICKTKSNRVSKK